MIKPEIRLILGLGILAALAPLLRFVGLSFILSGFALILYVHRWNWKKTVTRSILFGLVSCTPIFLWLYFYNFRLFGAFLYPTNPRRPDIWINLLQAVRKVYFWFVPYRPIFKDGVMDALIVLLGLLIILFISNRLINWKSLLHRIREPYVFCTLIYSAVYLGAITATANTSDHYALVSDRYYAVIIYFILVVLFICIEKLIQPHFPVSFRAFSLGLTVIAILWLMVPFSRMAEYILKSRASGEDGYNLYNTRVYHESDLMKYAIKLQHENPEANIYSNVPAAVWFFTRSNMLPLPNNYQSWTKDQFKKKMAGWPNDKPGYIVWFTPDPFEIFYSPKDLYLIADIYPIQKAADGTVYYVTVRK